MKPVLRWLAAVPLLALTLAMHCQADESVKPLPGNSVYQLPIQLTDQDGHTLTLAKRRGVPVIVSMFYNSCQFVCPMLIDTINNTEESLTAEQRDKLSVLLVTFDPARDSVSVLKSISTARHLDLNTWTLARTDAASVRKLAAVLGIQYRLLDNGDYNHTTALILLDGEGRILGSTNEIGGVDPTFLKLVQRAVTSH